MLFKHYFPYHSPNLRKQCICVCIFIYVYIYLYIRISIYLSIYRQTSHVNLLESEGTPIYRVDFKIIEVS